MARGRDQSLEAINGRLKAGLFRVAVFQKGNRLYLRATLPPKPGKEHKGWHQQDLSTGFPANRRGLEDAEVLARDVGTQLEKKTFSWTGSTKLSQGTNSIDETIARLKREYMSSHDIKESTWIEHYEKAVYSRLDRSKGLTAENMFDVVTKTEPNTRARKQACRKLDLLAKFAGLDIDLKKYQGNYGPSKVQARDLPSDELIEEWYGKIPNEAWRRVYARVMTFGIRPHEAWFFNRIDTHTAQITQGKTKPRITKAVPVKWAEEWDLEGELPNISWKDYRTLGRQASRQLNKYGLPFGLYDGRHAWCVRGKIVNDVPDQIMADYAGHSVDVHIKIYTRWIPNDERERIYQERVVGRG